MNVSVLKSGQTKTDSRNKEFKGSSDMKIKGSVDGATLGMLNIH